MEQAYNNLPQIDTLSDGDTVMLEEDVFSGDMEKPTYIGVRYVICEVMSNGGMTNNVSLKVIESTGHKPIHKGSRISRPKKNLFLKGRKVASKGVPAMTEKVGLESVSKGDKIKHRGRRYEVGGMTICMEKVVCRDLDSNQNAEIEVEDLLDNSSLIESNN